MALNPVERVRIVGQINGLLVKLGVDLSPQKAGDDETAQSIDLSTPAVIPEDAILQNRDRSHPASIVQMHSIAEKPDYERLSGTKDFGSGAPIVAYGKVPPAQLGKVTKAIMPDGSRYDVQYAVLEAGTILTSNDVNGATNHDYFSNDASHIRAIAGNGRVTGVTAAYKNGKAEEYRKALMADTSHGVPSGVIEKMKAPILVRVMQAKDVTKDIGDKSNRQTGLTMSAVEQANNDAERIDFSVMETSEDGTLKLESLQKFIAKMPKEELGQMIDETGTPTRQAEFRAQAAMFAKAYKNDELTRRMAQAIDVDARTIINGLNVAAPAMTRLAGLGDGFDVRDLVSEAAGQAMKAIAKRTPLSDLASQEAMFGSQDENAAVSEIIRLFDVNRRSYRGIGQALIRMSDALIQEYERRQADLFGGDLDVSREEIIKNALTEGERKAEEQKRKAEEAMKNIEANRATLDSIGATISSTALSAWDSAAGADAMQWLLFGNTYKPEEFFDSLMGVAARERF